MSPEMYLAQKKKLRCPAELLANMGSLAKQDEISEMCALFVYVCVIYYIIDIDTLLHTRTVYTIAINRSLVRWIEMKVVLMKVVFNMFKHKEWGLCKYPKMVDAGNKVQNRESISRHGNKLQDV